MSTSLVKSTLDDFGALGIDDNGIFTVRSGHGMFDYGINGIGGIVDSEVSHRPAAQRWAVCTP